MEAIYKLKATEINAGFVEPIKKLFKGKEITITITSEPDETTYLTMNPANEAHLMGNIAAEPVEKFSGNEFMEYVNKMDE